MVGSIRTEILDHLVKNPKPRASAKSYWTGRAIAKKLGMNESSVWKITKQFRDCGILEPEPPSRTTLAPRRYASTGGRAMKMRRTVQSFRGEVPCRLTPVGRRLGELMRFVRDQGIFNIDPQEQRIIENPSLLGKFSAAGFSQQEVKAAVDCGLIYEERTKSYTPTVGMATPEMIAASLRPQTPEYRYKYEIM